jgi:hypothetical protein
MPLTRSVISQLEGETGREVQGDKAVEVLFNLDRRVSKTVDQFGVGQARAPSN